MQTKKIYLDYSATTPIDGRVQRVISDAMAYHYGNASSIHSFGRKAKVILEESRETIAEAIGAETGEIFFTSGGTEADNVALFGTALSQKKKNQKNHILISAIEHHAVLECGEFLRQFGFDISIIPVDCNGIVDVNYIEQAITPQTLMISVMHANNEVGTIQPIQEISRIAKNNNVIFHTDAIQSFGKIPAHCGELGVDLLSLSAHKIYGPKGIGAIYIRKGVDVNSLIVGGAQERNHRAGTENIPLIAGFALASGISIEQHKKDYEHFAALRLTMKEMLTNSVEGIIFNGDQVNSLPNILSISLDSKKYNVETETLLLRLDLNGIAASSGSACTSGSIQPSHVLLAMGRDAKTAKSTVRFSFGRPTTMEEIIESSNIFSSITAEFLKI